MFNFQLKSAAKVRTFPHIHKQFVCFNTLRLFPCPKGKWKIFAFFDFVM